MPGLAFPSVGRLGLASPPSRLRSGCNPRYYAWLRLPTARLVSLHLSLAIRYPPCSLASCSACAARWGAEASRSAPGRLSQPVPLTWQVRWETVGSLKFPSCPLEHMPCSQTPVVSYSLAIARVGRLPSPACTASAFPLASTEIILGVRPWPRLYRFRGSITRPAPLRSPAPDARCRVCLWSSLPACWLDFDRMGLALAQGGCGYTAARRGNRSAL